MGSFLKFKQKSNWKPPLGTANLETFININEIELNKPSKTNSLKQNISDGERKAIRDLSRDKEIKISQADKGGSIVIQKTTDYIAEAMRQLNDPNTYKKTDSDLSNTHKQIVDNCLNQMVINGDITKKVQARLSIHKVRTPQIYFLPKIHKMKFPPPGRPIVSANDCATERISAFVDHFLNPLVKETRSYIQDTTDFLNQIEKVGHVKKNTILGTLDVTSLYTNIPNSEGISAISEILDEKRKSWEKPSNKSLVQLLELVLKLNNFQFNGTNYLQIGGTAMGTRLAPSLANLFMDRLERRMLDGYRLKPTVWLRYIDDVFFIWDHGENSLNEWFNYLNAQHKTIKFTTEFSKKQINFLDTTIKIDETGKLSADLYKKPTDSNSYLNFSSAHPPNCKKSLPFSQLLRIKRICSKKSDYEKHAQSKLKEFRTKGFPEQLLAEATEKVQNYNREDLLTKKNQSDENIERENKIFLVTTFRPGHEKVPKLVKKNWPYLGRSTTTKDIYNSRLMVSHRRGKNLREMLCKSRLNYTANEGNVYQEGKSKTDMKKCRTKNCKFCPLLDKSGKIVAHYGKEYITKHNVTCNSTNVIYCIECVKCSKRYVGQTKRSIKKRIGEHLSSIKKQKDNAVGDHFNRCSCKPDKKDLKIHILDFIFQHPKSDRASQLRNTIEYNWIHRLKTVAPAGMNLKDCKY